MQARIAFLPVVLGLILAAVLAATSTGQSGKPDALPKTLRPAASFGSIADVKARSVALFREAGKVFLHPRCTNCHTGTDSPFRTDRQIAHLPRVKGGRTGKGSGGSRCANCHGRKVTKQGRIPSDPRWALAPAVVGWKGKSLSAICAQIKDRKRNGGRDLPALVKHMQEDSLIRWSWSPGPAANARARDAWAICGAGSGVGGQWRALSAGIDRLISSGSELYPISFFDM